MATMDLTRSDRPANTANSLMMTGLIIPVRIGYDPRALPGTCAIPDIPLALRAALIDTGSQITCIDADLVASLALPIIGETTIYHPGGSRMLRMCRAHIIFVQHRIVQDCDCAVSHELTSRPGHRIDALIGRVNLQQFVLHYDGARGVAGLKAITP